MSLLLGGFLLLTCLRLQCLCEVVAEATISIDVKLLVQDCLMLVSVPVQERKVHLQQYLMVSSLVELVLGLQAWPASSNWYSATFDGRFLRPHLS